MNIYNFYSYWFVIISNLYSLITFDTYLILGIIITVFFQSFIKDIVDEDTYKVLKRPDDAYDCNITNDDGFCGDEPGFPSGHVASASFFFTLLLLRTNNFTKENLIKYNIPVVIMGIARYKKSCHNVTQIIGGYILGLIVAFSLFRLETSIKIKKTNKQIP